MDFSDLVSSRKQNSQNWNQYRNEIYSVYGHLVSNLIKYLSIPKVAPPLLYVVPADRNKREKGHTYSIPGAVKLDDLGWASIGIVLDLRETTGNHAVIDSHPYAFVFMIRKNEGNWQVKYLRDGDIFTIQDPEVESDYHQLFDNFTEFFSNWMLKSHEIWLSGSQEKQIGFEL